MLTPRRPNAYRERASDEPRGPVAGDNPNETSPLTTLFALENGDDLSGFTFPDWAVMILWQALTRNRVWVDGDSRFAEMFPR